MKPTGIETTDRDGGFVLVCPIWGGVDRPNVGGVVVKDQRMADRLSAAIMAGAVYPDAKVATDVNGKTYVTSNRTVRGRAMNADLKRLGF